MAKIVDNTAGRILVVDDERQIRLLLSRFLEGAGYLCREARDARTARKMLSDSHYDLMLSDIHMPGESGIDLARHVKATCARTGIVMVSVIDNPSEARDALDIGVYGYIIKPFTRNSVLICVENAMKRHRLELRVKGYQQMLEQEVQARTAALHDTNERLRRREAELAVRMEELEASNNALRVVLRQRETDRLAIEESVMANVDKTIKPCIDRLKKNHKMTDGQLRELGLLETGLEELVSPFAKRLSSDYLKLTPNEIKVASLVRQGLATKEIADLLNLSENTIMTHRYKIRTKLGIKNKRQSLHTFLANLQ